MEDRMAAKGARTIVEKCACVREGETVFLISDCDTFAEAQLIAQAAVEANVSPVEITSNECSWLMLPYRISG